ncbi:16S rRNA (cytosine967-C5)-methyltransferase [Atopostipes suicloacalis DSM 15692]|uniref:16S rRNA (cytosine(967)-C(5))-methyltransferase n=1 Tax=Atopostipes suicloacalis DSM 15692 TaxID=1121025 RepID=A0A1M4VVX5_9LACT|nr:16S rRNA (cytosine(967)-C(5))-methyltransferase RsmB [Atopostipes suicloacalis]SHE72882.1 16S rRNA (cytosine967-C5)-methyltransferase [Atopostipes suicloacalis DSM 15692]
MAKKKEILQSSRYLAVEILEKIEQENAYSNLLLREVINNQELSKEEANLLTELVYGVLQRRMLLDYQLEPFLKKQKKLAHWVRQLLRLSLYQMEFLDRIPDHAIINEAANIARVKGHRGIVGLVNGVLRNIQRKGVRETTHLQPLNKRLSIQYSLPQWLIDEFIKQHGEKEAEAFAKSFSERPKLSLRVNLRKISREAAIDELKEEGFDVTESTISPYGIIVEKGVPIESRLFKEGYLAVQDESSMLVAPALNVKPSHYVLDACAAPGGKTMHIATSFLDKEEGGKIVALDIHEHKINLIKDNAKRLKVKEVVEAKHLDARQVLNEFKPETFDRILIDAPCSGLGLMRRRPEIRYNKTKQDILSLQKLQLEILNEASKTLKLGGELIYSTCTITQEENQEVVRQFLEKNKEFSRAKVELPESELQVSKDGSLTIYPHQYGTDGFFICRLKKQ